LEFAVKKRSLFGKRALSSKIIGTLILIIVLTTVGIDAAVAERLAIKNDIANIRSGPSTDASILWKVEKYYPVTIIDKQGDWYLFKDFEGDEGWIHRSLVAPMDTVVVKRDNCNIRSGPGTDHEILFTAERGIPFKVLQRQGVWLQIQHADGDTGWIHKNLIW
jgi:SH3-like domain-containing protein